MSGGAELCQTAGGDSVAEPEERLVVQSATLGGRVAPTRVLLAPWGEVESANGRFLVDEESARLVMEAHEAHGTDIPIDYEHQSLGGAYASPNGQAPAAGWIRGLRVVTPAEAGEGRAGLYGDVEWTSAAEQRLAAREYRYLSPVVLVRKSDRRVVALHSAALTNKPAIVGMQPIVNRQADGGRDPAQDPQVGHEDASLCPDVASEGLALEILKQRLGLGCESDLESVLAAAERQLSFLADRLGRREAQDKVDAALRAGKLSRAQREWALSLAMRDVEAFDAWAASAPVLVMPGRISPPAPASAGKAGSRAVVIASAKRAFRSTPELALMTSESAWIDDALREAGLDS